MVTDIGDITADHSPFPVNAMTEVGVLEGIPHSLLPATTAAHATLQPIDAPITTPAIVAPHPTLLPQVPFIPLHGLESVSLQQLPPDNARIPTQESQAMSKTLNPT